MRARVAKRKWHSLRSQRPRDVVFAVECMGVLLLSDVALRSIGLTRWTRILARRARPSTASHRGKLDSAQGLAVRSAYKAVEMACRNVPHTPTCLPRAVTLWWALRRHGVQSELQFGVRKRGEKLEAHASVVCGPLVFYDGRRAGYEPLHV